MVNKIGTYLCKEGGLFTRMAKGVNLPSCSRAAAVSKVMLDELQAFCVLVYDSIIMSGRLIVHTPTSKNKLKSTWNR